ncbi:MAG: hypothetical protein BMS9Abin18_0741 [Zetaproteobacteria bacterium]|nr:MAG: hypothetical protein BMS9Abin18_0741 [Zetaproteobacteria bacterium]
MAATVMLCFALLLVAGCGTKKPQAITRGKPSAVPPITQMASVPKTSASIQALMSLAFEEGNMEGALADLERLANEAQPPLNEEASFRRVQLLLLVNDEQAMTEAEKLLAAYPEHALVPYLHMWIAQWAEGRQDDALVLTHTAAALLHPRLTLEIANRAAGLGAAAARRSPDWEAVQWFLNVARSAAFSAGGRRDGWLREAANRASMSMVGRLRDGGRLRGNVGKAFYLHVARAHLITGDMAAVQTLSTWLEQDFPHTDEAFQVSTWAAGITHPVNIGILLPLTGEYERFGGQALRGMRLALDSLQDSGQITLHIADTEGNAGQCVSAYQQLANEGVNIILGPLLSDCAAALTPYLHDRVPILSLTNRLSLAPRSPMLFVHTLALAMQARFMAVRAWQQGEHRMVVIGAGDPSSEQEADAFVQMFEELGGEVVDRFDLPRKDIDFRPDLRAMRMRTDDEALLAELDEELALSIEPDQEIRMPVNFDAVYLALPGKQVALLAGQLAYVDVNEVRLYGSGRWQDGNLLSDKGRYLGRAQFSDVAFPNGASPDLRRFMLAWRDIWGVDKPGKLAGLAYDSTLIAALLTSRLGLSGRSLLTGLHDISGFPGLTGHVRFDEDGVGHKDFELFRVRRGHIVPAG